MRFVGELKLPADRKGRRCVFFLPLQVFFFVALFLLFVVVFRRIVTSFNDEPAGSNRYVFLGLDVHEVFPVNFFLP